MPKAARLTDMHTCPAVNPGPVPHVGGPISSGSPDVNVGYLPAARVDDTAICVPAVDAISSGSSNVFINHKKAARIGDPTKHGGVIVSGCPTVNIGQTPQTFALLSAAETGAPFCEECEKAKRQREELRAPPPPNEPPVDSVAPKPPPVKPNATTPELAKQQNETPDDGHNNARQQARQKVAGDFLANHAAAISSADIESHLRNIDMSKPVEIVSFPGAGAGPQGAKLWSAVVPGAAAGAYRALTAQAATSQLGLSALGLSALGLSALGLSALGMSPAGAAGASPPQATPRVAQEMVASQKAPFDALKSTSLSGVTQLIVL